MEQVRNFIDLVGQGNNVDAKAVLDELLSTRAFEALDARKQQIAQTLYASDEQETETPEETETETTEQE